MNTQDITSPSLLVDADWFEETRARKGHDSVFDAMATELKRRCDVLLDPESPKYLDCHDLASRWWKTRMGSKQLVVATWDLATGAHLFQDNRYADLAVNILRTLTKHNMAENSGGTCYGRSYKSWLASTLDGGHAAESLGASFDLLLPFLDPTEAVEIGNYLRKFVHALERHIQALGDEECPNLQNIPMIGKFGVGVMAAVLEKLGIVDAERYLEISRNASLQYLEGGGHEEGILSEGPMYGFACLKHIAIVGTIFFRKGDPAIWESDVWDRMVEAYASQVIPCDGTINTLNDCYPVRITSWLLAVAKHRKNGLARWLWETIVQPLGEKRWDAPVAWDDIRAPWWNGLLPHALPSYDPSVKPCPPDEYGVQKSRYFGIRGIVDQRSGWEEDDWYLNITCCPDVRWRNRIGTQHYQADRGHFSLYGLGEKFAIDSGYGNEVLAGSTEVIRFGATGEAHNTHEINGAMQKKSEFGGRISATHLDSWASAAKLELGGCYDACSRVSRTVVLVPDLTGHPLYLIVHDCIMPAAPKTTTYGLLLHTDEANQVHLLDRETVDLLGGRKGNRCRVITTANRPGRFMVDQFLDHPRLRFQNQGPSFHALSLLIPYRKDERPPLFERSMADHDAGFVARLRFREVQDNLLLCARGSIAEWGMETDAVFGLLREGAKPQLVVIEGTFLRKDGKRDFEAGKREDYLGPAHTS